jgi:hypothetical protein
VLAVLALAACGEDPDPFRIARNQLPDPSTCELFQARRGTSAARGTFDLVIGDRSSYILTPLVENNGSADITITTARLEAYEERDGESFRLNFACHVPEGCDEWEIDVCEGVCPVVEAGSTASFEVQALPRVVTGYYQIMMDLAAREGRRPPQFDIRAVVRLVGETDGGEIVSAPFELVVTLCLGCLVEFPPGSDDPAVLGPDCCGPATIPASCYPGQDAPIDCHLCTTTSPELCNFGRTRCEL